MKLRISTIILGASMMMAGASCVKKDNFEGPDASLEGNIIQEGTKTNVQTGAGNFTIRLEQLSWSETPSPQDISVKIDGSYKNSKLFKGHYRVAVKGGAFWATEPVEIDIDKGTKQDFEVIPYLTISDLRYELIGDSVKLNFDIAAPIESGLPTITEIQPYVNTTRLVGPGASIYDYSDVLKKTINMEWIELTEEQRSPEIIIPDLVRGRTFFIRVGVKFNNDDKSSNLSEIIEVKIPE